ncbi:MAG: hypothetical protein IJO64_04350 [Clostridia bacterium]|nr:hypothetical protein [Clostridia bacterium]
MKRITALIISALMLAFCLFSCNTEGTESSGGDSNVSYESKTSAFYGNMNKSSFWFRMNFTKKNETCVFTQVTNGKTTTTIKDYEDDSKDVYDIFDGSIIHHIRVDEKAYDSTLSASGQAFLFADYTASMFASPSSVGNDEYNGKQYYCETFDTAAAEGGAVSGKNMYFFDGDKLVAVEIYEKGEKVMVMEFIEYSNTLPNDIYLSAPDDFKKGNLAIDVSTTISVDDWWE